MISVIAQDDVMNTITILRKGASAKVFNAPKIFNGRSIYRKNAI